MKKGIWFLIALVLGLLDALFARTLGLGGLSISLVILSIAGLFLIEEFTAGVILIVAGSLFSDLLTTRDVGWFALFGTIVMLLVGLVRYFVGVTDDWMEWAMTVIFLLALYFFDLLIIRGFEVPTDALAGTSVINALVWLTANAVLLIIFRFLYLRAAGWIEKE